MTLIGLRLSILCCVGVSILSCSKNEQENVVDESFSHKTNEKPLTVGSYHVTDSFNVGVNVFVRALTADEANNQLWVGTSVGVLSVDVKTGVVNQTYTRDNGLANEYVFAAYAAIDGSVWFGTNGGGVSRLSQNPAQKLTQKNKQAKWETYFPMHGLADYWVYSFTEQKSKAMWVGTWAGLSRFDYQNQQFTTYVKELSNEWVYGLDVDSKDNVWVGTEEGVNMFDGKSWRVWTHEQGLGAVNKRKLGFSANTGLGTRTRHDLSILSGGEETYNPNYIFCVKVGLNDTVWAGTWGGGVSFYDGTKWQNLSSEDGLAGDIVYSIEVDAEGNYWFGTNKGLSVYDGKHWQTLTKSDGLLDSHVYALAVTSKNQIWAGTKNGVAVIKHP